MSDRGLLASFQRQVRSLVVQEVSIWMSILSLSFCLFSFFLRHSLSISSASFASSCMITLRIAKRPLLSEEEQFEV